LAMPSMKSAFAIVMYEAVARSSRNAGNHRTAVPG
jgi:hypothetical protein